MADKKPKFEYDLRKRGTTIEKHKIDFESAKRVWDDPDAIAVPANNINEVRFGIHGVVDGTPWTVIFTLRGEIIRIITCRRGWPKERKAYEEIKDRTK